MDLIQLIGTLTQYMVEIIIALAVVEIGLLLWVRQQCRFHHVKLLDTYRNAVKGMLDVPDSLLSRDSYSQCNALRTYIEKIISTDDENAAGVRRNIGRQFENNMLSDSHSFQARFRIASTLVQIFPLLGILGTILSLGQLDFSVGEVDASAITKAFVIAIDTTILGMFFAIVFMLCESKLSVTLEHVIDNTEKAFRLMNRVVN